MSVDYYKKLQIEVEAHKMSERLAASFAKAKQENRGILGIFVSAGDPDTNTSIKILDGLIESGVDMIELGMPFSDPMADGPAIQAASLRAIKSGTTLRGSLEIASQFRKKHADTPLILMGYYNPIYSRGVEKFLVDAKQAGIDGLIVVDLPPEEDSELCIPAQAAGLNFIRLATPTTDNNRLPKVLQNTSGFVYYVSITGITGAAEASADGVAPEVARIKAQTDLPIIVGFGVNTPAKAQAIAGVADGAVVGSAIVSKIAAGDSPAKVLEFVASLAAGAHKA